MSNPIDQIVVEERVSPRPEAFRILVTNDDGISSPGLRDLAAVLAVDFEVIVVAPRSDMSGSGTGLGHFDPRSGVELTSVELPGVEEAYSVDGPPGLAVLAAGLGAFGRKPDLVVSGVNAGVNTGHSVVHSGTVGAALTARTLGSHGLAVSLAESRPWHWETAIDVAASATRWFAGSPRRLTVLNVNVPARPIGRVAGIRWADLDAFGHLQVAVADVPGSRLAFEVRGSSSGIDPVSDTALCFGGFVTLTVLSAVEPNPYPPIDASELWRPPS